MQQTGQQQRQQRYTGGKQRTHLQKDGSAHYTECGAARSCVRQADAVSQAARHALVTSRGSVAQKRTDASAPVGTAMAAKKENSVTSPHSITMALTESPYGGNKTRLRRNGVRLCFLRDGTAAGGHAFARLRCAGHGGPETARYAATFAQANKKCGGQPADK